MGNNSLPDRWLPYSPVGTVVPGTRFFACKVPLKEAILRKLPKNKRFGTNDLMEAFPKLGLLIDLTNTMRYYFKQDFTVKDIRYEKICCPGRVIPPDKAINKFVSIVNDFLKTNEDPEVLIGVHCTHGVNRTGYFICRYMIQQMKISPEVAIESFQNSRGHEIERENYVRDLKNGCKGGAESNVEFTYSKQKGLDKNNFQKYKCWRQSNNNKITQGNKDLSPVRRRLFSNAGRGIEDEVRDQILNNNLIRENVCDNSHGYSQAESSDSNTRPRFKWTPNSSLALTPGTPLPSWIEPHNSSSCSSKEYFRSNQSHGTRRIYLPQQSLPPTDNNQLPQYGLPNQHHYPRVGTYGRSRRRRGHKRKAF